MNEANNFYFLSYKITFDFNNDDIIFFLLNKEFGFFNMLIFQFLSFFEKYFFLLKIIIKVFL